MNLPKTVSSQTKIRFQHCDPFNHLNNGSYIDYFMNHREDQLIKHYNIDIYAMAQKLGVSWVSSSNQIAYLKPALLMETITIESQLIDHDSSNLKVEMRMYNEDKTQLKAIIWCGFTHFNLLTQTRAMHSENMVDLFKSIVTPVSETSFEKRVASFKPAKANI